MDFEVYKDVKFEMSKILFQIHNNTFNNPKKQNINNNILLNLYQEILLIIVLRISLFQNIICK